MAFALSTIEIGLFSCKRLSPYIYTRSTLVGTGVAMYTAEFCRIDYKYAAGCGLAVCLATLPHLLSHLFLSFQDKWLLCLQVGDIILRSSQVFYICPCSFKDNELVCGQKETKSFTMFPCLFPLLLPYLYPCPFRISDWYGFLFPCIVGSRSLQHPLLSCFCPGTLLVLRW